MYTLGLAILAVHLHIAGLTHITSLQSPMSWVAIAMAEVYTDGQVPTDACGPRCSSVFCHWLPWSWAMAWAHPSLRHWPRLLCTHSEALQPLEYMLTARVPQLLVSPDSALSPVTDLYIWAPLYLASLALCLPLSCPLPDTGLYCHMPGVRLRSRGSAHGQTVPPQLPVDLQLTPTLLACSVLHHDVRVCSWPLPLHRHCKWPCGWVCAHHRLWPPLLTTLVPSGWNWRHHWGLQKPLQPLQSPQCSPKTMCCQCHGPQWPKPKRHHSPQTWSHNAPTHWGQGHSML